MRKRNWKRSRAVVVGLACMIAAVALALPAAEKKKKSKIVPEAILIGNVFQESGFSLRGARVVVTNPDSPKARKETTTDIQGEFAVRVPAGKARYTVEVSAPGFVSETKTVEVTGDERVEMTFRLPPLGK